MEKWPGPESNRRHLGFQPSALPTELPGRGMSSLKELPSQDNRVWEPSPEEFGVLVILLKENAG
jgi:hypothetical protein